MGLVTTWLRNPWVKETHPDIRLPNPFLQREEKKIKTCCPDAGEEHGPPRARPHGRVPGTGLSVSALHFTRSLPPARQALCPPTPGSWWLLGPHQPLHQHPDSTAPSGWLILRKPSSSPRGTPSNTESQGRESRQWWGETELYLTSSLILLYKEAWFQYPHPGSAVLVTAITVLDPSNSAALTSGIASLAPLTLNHFLQPPLLPAAWPPAWPPARPDAGYPPTLTREGRFSGDPRARHHTCRRVPLRQSALLSSSVRREVREALIPEAALPPMLPAPHTQERCDGSLLTTRSPPRTDIGYKGIPKGRDGAPFVQEGAQDTEANRCSAFLNTAEAPLAT